MNANLKAAAKLVLPHARSVEAVRSMKNGAYQVTYVASYGRRSTFLKRSEIVDALSDLQHQEIASVVYDDNHFTQPWVVLAGRVELHRANTQSKCVNFVNWHNRQQQIAWTEDWRALRCG